MVADLHVRSPKFGTATEPGSVAATLGVVLSRTVSQVRAEHTGLQESFSSFDFFGLIFFFLDCC